MDSTEFIHSLSIIRSVCRRSCSSVIVLKLHAVVLVIYFEKQLINDFSVVFTVHIFIAVSSSNVFHRGHFTSFCPFMKGVAVKYGNKKTMWICRDSDRPSWWLFPTAERFHIFPLREAGGGTMIDLSHLTEEEQGMIMTVLRRDAELKKAEEERVR